MTWTGSLDACLFLRGILLPVVYSGSAHGRVSVRVSGGGGPAQPALANSIPQKRRVFIEFSRCSLGHGHHKRKSFYVLLSADRFPRTMRRFLLVTVVFDSAGTERSSDALRATASAASPLTNAAQFSS